MIKAGVLYSKFHGIRVLYKLAYGIQAWRTDLSSDMG